MSVIDVPTGPEVGFRVEMLGPGEVTVKGTPLLATVPTVTTTLPVVAPLGTGTVILVSLQFVGVPAIPLNVTVPEPCVAPKLDPAILTIVPNGPEVGFRLEMAGVTRKFAELLLKPATVTTIAAEPGDAPFGTEKTIVVAFQLVAATAMPAKVIVLAP